MIPVMLPLLASAAVRDRGRCARRPGGAGVAFLVPGLLVSAGFEVPQPDPPTSLPRPPRAGARFRVSGCRAQGRRTPIAQRRPEGSFDVVAASRTIGSPG